jgi:hypothetical protein
VTGQPGCACAATQALGSPVTPLLTTTGGTVHLLGCSQHISEVLGPYSFGLGMMTGATLGVVTGASPELGHELLAAAADILRGGAHDGCAAPKGRGCREHVRTYDARAARLRAALAAVVAPLQ